MINEYQPDPKDGDTPVWQLVIRDMKERNEIGTKKYGTPLVTNNGRDALVDAYQEALDLTVYLRQEIEERQTYPTAREVLSRALASQFGIQQDDLPELYLFGWDVSTLGEEELRLALHYVVEQQRRINER